MWQMSRITRAKGALAYDDRIDVLSMAVSSWVEQMGQDVHRKMLNHAEDAFQKEIDRFVDNALGRKARDQDSWINI
jgi:hypothetical protein